MIVTSSAHVSTTSYETLTAPLLPISETWDHLLAFSSIACFIVGTVGNILALIYFANQRKDLPTKIYILMAITDALSCFLVMAVGLSFINERQAGLFEISWLCDIWSTVWNVTPYFSVFLVLVLSVVRTISVKFPFTEVKHKVVLAIITLYLVYLIARIVGPQIMNKSYNDFDEDYRQHVYCGINIYKVDAIYHYTLASNVIQLAGPVIPIIVSCVISCYCVLKSRKATALSRRTCVQKSLSIPKTSVSHQASVESEASDGSRESGTWNKVKRTARNLSTTVSLTSGRTARNLSTISNVSSMGAGKDRQIRATITILLITGMYIVFNIPVFIYYLFFVVEMFIMPRDKWVFLVSDHVNFYGWNLVFVQCVALNAAINPVVYCWRIEKMRHFYAWRRITAWLKSCKDHVQVCLGLKDKCHIMQRRSVSGASNGYSRTYVEVIQEEAAV